MGHCNHLILHCMDYRIQSSINEWIQKQGYENDIDRISIGGACKHQQAALDNISIGCERHGVKKIFLIQHEDCAGYGGQTAFPSRQAEREKLVSDMQQLKQHLGDIYPEVSVSTLLVQQIQGGWELIEIQTEHWE